MAAKFEKTRYPGIYKRGSSYVLTYRVGGKQRKESCRTLEEARKKKAARQAAIDAGEFQEKTRVTFADFAREWVERYQGRGRGFRESTRDDYRRLLNTYAIPYFDGRLRRKLSAVQPRDIANFVGWLCDAKAQAEHQYELDRGRALAVVRERIEEAEAKLEEARRTGDPAAVGQAERDLDWARKRRPRVPKKPDEEVAGAERALADIRLTGDPQKIEKAERRLAKARKRTEKHLSDSTIRNALNPIRALYSTAVAEGLVRFNPTAKVALPDRPSVDEDDHDDEVRPFTREQLKMVLQLAPERHRLLLRFLAATGLRISEAVALQWRHLHLDGSRPHVKVRRALVRGRVHPPKSRHGRRDVPLDPALVDALRRHHRETEWPEADHPVFASTVGGPLQVNNLRRRQLAPLFQEIDAPWASFHSFRHTYTSLLIARGENIVRISRLLGHHSAAFTLSVYAHLLPDDAAAPLDLGAELSGVRTAWEHDPAETHRNGAAPAPTDPASEAEITDGDEL
jgi:integrase